MYDFLEIVRVEVSGNDAYSVDIDFDKLVIFFVRGEKGEMVDINCRDCKKERQSFSVGRQHFSDFISAYSTGVRTCLSLSARTVKLSDFVKIVQCVQHKSASLRLCLVMSVQNQYLSKLSAQKRNVSTFLT